ncbi:hypothetical protein RvY_00049 [Ramazzottius varieornatus]|uniref:Reverse transcriptase domain-containing protein n=1 Tax=Ramazzottius varieornatus TaxID=947166 RepID=A0A1D1UBU9_RAMVA|nr:hypothetical protein RvY_00049 [Ramazzottius varieornatus]
MSSDRPSPKAYHSSLYLATTRNTCPSKGWCRPHRVFLKEKGQCGEHRQPIHGIQSTVTRCKHWLPTVSAPEVWNVLKRMPVKKAAGSSLLTNALMKAAVLALVYPLTRLFHLVLSTKHYPTSWKKADVVSVPKKALSERKEVEAVFLDCTKAFDRVPHEVLVRSLQAHAIIGDLLQLLSHYLRGRTQRVTVGGYYMNRLSESVKCELFQYADNFVANRMVGKLEDCQALQECLVQLGENCAGARLRPKPKQVATYPSVLNYGYSIDGQKMPTESQSTCLGVVPDNKLNRTAQVDAATAKCRKRLHVIRSCFPAQFGTAKQMLYKILVRLVTEYTCSVWNPASHKHQRQLEQVQKDFLRSIRLSRLLKGQHDSDFSQYRQHLTDVQWKYLWERRAKAVMVNAFKIWTNGFPD